MLGVGVWAEDAILDGVEAHVEKGARVRSRPKVCAEADAALRVYVAAEGHVCRAPEGLEVAVSDAEAFLARDGECRRQKTGGAVARLDGDRRVWEPEDRNVLDEEARLVDAHAVGECDCCARGLEAPLRNLIVAAGRYLAAQDDDLRARNLLDAVGCEVHDRAVLRLIGEASRVLEEAGLGRVVPLGARACDALELALIEDDVAFGDDAVLRLVDRHLVGL